MRNVSLALLRFVFAVAILLAMLGCNSENLPGLGRVTGTIKFDGKPLNGAMVEFDKVGGGIAPAFGKTDATGKYELYYSRTAKGAAIGEHEVRVTAFADAGETGKVQKETIPAKYNVMTELKATVKSGSNTLDFDLKPGGQIIQPNTESKAERTGCF